MIDKTAAEQCMLDMCLLNIVDSNQECLSRLIMLIGNHLPSMQDDLEEIFNEWIKVNNSVHREHKNALQKLEQASKEA